MCHHKEPTWSMKSTSDNILQLRASAQTILDHNLFSLHIQS